MISLKRNGNSILGEFIRLTEAPGLRKEAIAKAESDFASDSDSESVLDNLAAEVEEKAEDFLVDQNAPAADPVAAAIDKEVEAFASRDMQIMTGLGKIAASLRLKGEGFAADMVEATAISISDDIKKEAAERGSLVGNLEKLAGDFDRDGDTFAGDMVRATISNIVSN